MRSPIEVPLPISRPVVVGVGDIFLLLSTGLRSVVEKSSPGIVGWIVSQIIDYFYRHVVVGALVDFSELLIG